LGHNNPPLTLRGKLILSQRVVGENRPVAHVAKELGISRQCAHRWVSRYRELGEAGLVERSSRPHSTPTRTSPQQEAAVLQSRRELKAGPLRIAAATDVSARTVSRILARNNVPPLAWCDPLTGELIRASRATAVRYERERPGELVHVDVKKLGRIPDGGGWRAEGKNTIDHHGRRERVRVGFDYVHAVIDDHTRLAYAEIHNDETGKTAAGVLPAAASRGSNASSPTTPSPTADRTISRTPSPPSALSSGSSNPTAPGPTGKSSD